MMKKKKNHKIEYYFNLIDFHRPYTTNGVTVSFYFIIYEKAQLCNRRTPFTSIKLFIRSLEFSFV